MIRKKTHPCRNFPRAAAWSLCLFLLLLPSMSSSQTSYPSRPISMVIGWPPGGSTDISIRLLTAEASKDLGAAFVVLNKPGGGGMVGSETVRQSKPDGYTLLATTIGFMTIPLLDQKAPYTIDDFDAICLYATKGNVITVKADSAFKTIQDVLDYAKKNPGKLTYGSAGIGSTGHFFGEMFKQAVGVEMSHVPFKGDALIGPAVLGGHVDLGFSTIPGAFSLMKGEKLRGLAISCAQSSPDFPEIPTVAQIGHPDATFEAWDGIAGPKGLPKPVLDKLAASLERAMKNETVLKGLRQIGQNPVFWGPAKYKGYMKQESERMKKIVEKADMAIKY